MTKTTKILTPTLFLATSVLAFSANASTVFDANSVKVTSYNQATQYVAPVEVGQKSKSVFLVVGAEKNFTSEAKPIKDLKKLEETLKAPAPVNTFLGAVAYEGKKWSVQADKPLAVEVPSTRIRHYTSEVKHPYGVLDVLESQTQEGILQRRKDVADACAIQMNNLVTLLNGVRTAYEGVLAQDGKILAIKTKEDYWKAIQSVHDEMYGTLNVSAAIRNPTVDELTHVKPAKLQKFKDFLKARKAEITSKEKLHADLFKALDGVTYKIANTYRRGNSEATRNVNEADVEDFNDITKANYVARTSKEKTTDGKTHWVYNGAEFMAIESLILDAKFANSMSKAWDLYQDILSGKAVYKVAATPVESTSETK
ncbi:MAG: hypothetical protein KBB83_04865 [Alphaproteobacteria bacterium]|nr:hypothetical protein [Alphaproteobacteria bacterium]